MSLLALTASCRRCSPPRRTRSSFPACSWPRSSRVFSPHSSSSFLGILTVLGFVILGFCHALYAVRGASTMQSRLRCPVQVVATPATSDYPRAQELMVDAFGRFTSKATTCTLRPVPTSLDYEKALTSLNALPSMKDMQQKEMQNA